MTNDEAKMLKGKTVEDLAAARARLTCLEAKRDGMKQIAKIVLAYLNEEPLPDVSPPGRDLPPFPTGFEMSGVLSDIHQTKERIASLEQRLKEFGL